MYNNTAHRKDKNVSGITRLTGEWRQHRRFNVTHYVMKYSYLHKQDPSCEQILENKQYLRTQRMAKCNTLCV